ncbi:flavin-containing amine oxidoreductase-domain containing protein [Lasiosphaeria miniovina]|uniref:Flavin-containing amine oxidoreductase-domain containing protein n=1 Tax=Lasiosphaeria miniovina TaxID=1954250 RepID=A0AA40E4C3_9PEZI|nr:flavin-containing amine oxidoreductase-domain containing protein [Lasiosphaeria miniovina]KAK0727624.1 flavin-containing amine oxidoreductase-domain containing protein [Lasiosphaeria miniovina]
MKVLPAAGMALLASTAQGSPSPPLKIQTRTSLDSRLSNVHLDFLTPIRESIDLIYGSCDSLARASGSHHAIGQTISSSHDRVVWVIPEDAYSGGCISAWGSSTGLLLGRSREQHVDLQTMDRRRHSRRRSRLPKRDDSPHNIYMDNSTGVDVWGPWFEGVELLKNSETVSVDAAAAKRKNIAIVGAGMSGLMAFLCLTQQGMTNVSIIEAGSRLGGRVQTVYLSGGPFDYSYQEMGPMRFPTTLTVNNETHNVSDHQLVFQLADEMNRINNHDRNLSVDFIPWYDSSDRDDGWYPSEGSLRTGGNGSVRPFLQSHRLPDPSTRELFNKVNKALPCKDFCVEMARNMFRAHRKWLDNGLGDIQQWSEYAFMANYITARSNSTNPEFVGKGASSFWDKLYEGMYANATTWRTVDGDSNKVTLQFPGADADPWINSTHDYVMLAVPFSAMKNWSISGLSTTMQDAITRLPYASACKVALEFETRFWEHLSEPIYGTCRAAGREMFPGIGNICYPSYNLNGTGRGALLASYISEPGWGDKWASVSERDHVQYVLDAMIKIHGDVARRQYTGKFSRVCGCLDPLEGASWADPTVRQHQIYLPEYFKTHNNMIFVGEHTSLTHA